MTVESHGYHLTIRAVMLNISFWSCTLKSGYIHYSTALLASSDVPRQRLLRPESERCNVAVAMLAVTFE
jgi:hypothetical protein